MMRHISSSATEQFDDNLFPTAFWSIDLNIKFLEHFEILSTKYFFCYRNVGSSMCKYNGKSSVNDWFMVSHNFILFFLSVFMMRLLTSSATESLCWQPFPQRSDVNLNQVLIFLSLRLFDKLLFIFPEWCHYSLLVSRPFPWRCKVQLSGPYWDGKF